METSTKVSTKMANSMAKASMFGLMVHVIKVSLSREQDMGKAVGNQQKIMATYT